jgi:hypothetical protein
MLLHADYRGVNARQILSVACIHEAAGKSANRAGVRHFFGAVTILTLRWSKCRVIRVVSMGRRNTQLESYLAEFKGQK